MRAAALGFGGLGFLLPVAYGLKRGRLGLLLLAVRAGQGLALIAASAIFAGVRR
jgi:hypothetical protein